MDVRLFVGGAGRVPNELQRSLAFQLAVDESPALSPQERLAIVERAGLRSYLSDPIWAELLMRGRCYELAELEFERLGHWRKLGDLAWGRGDWERARECYERPAGPTRMGKDWDRLMKLAYAQREWVALIRAFMASDCEPGIGPDRILLCRTDCSARPYAQMLAEAVAEAGMDRDAAVTRSAREKLGIDSGQWKALVDTRLAPDDPTRARLMRNSVPRKTAAPGLTHEEVIRAGSTTRSQKVAHFVVTASQQAARAKKALKVFLASGSQEALEEFRDRVLVVEDPSMCQTVLFYVLELDMEAVVTAPAELRIRLFGVHPIMNKRHFGRLLSARFEAGHDVAPGDVVTGLFQTLWIPAQTAKQRKLDERFDLDKLAASVDWAEAKLDDWLEAEGKEAAREVRRAWANDSDRFAGARDLSEWRALVRMAQGHLADRWAAELAHEQWIQEAKLFQLLTKSLRGVKVTRHAQPIWLAPQHFDCFIEDAQLAVEYMGEQHYTPVEVFGGEVGFRRTLERDERKRLAAARAGVRLDYVRHDEDLGSRCVAVVAIARRRLAEWKKDGV